MAGYGILGPASFRIQVDRLFIAEKNTPLPKVRQTDTSFEVPDPWKFIGSFKDEIAELTLKLNKESIDLGRIPTSTGNVHFQGDSGTIRGILNRYTLERWPRPALYEEKSILVVREIGTELYAYHSSISDIAVMDNHIQILLKQHHDRELLSYYLFDTEYEPNTQEWWDENSEAVRHQGKTENFKEMFGPSASYNWLVRMPRKHEMRVQTSPSALLSKNCLFCGTQFIRPNEVEFLCEPCRKERDELMACPSCGKVLQYDAKQFAYICQFCREDSAISNLTIYGIGGDSMGSRTELSDFDDIPTYENDLKVLTWKHTVGFGVSEDLPDKETTSRYIHKALYDPKGEMEDKNCGCGRPLQKIGEAYNWLCQVCVLRKEIGYRTYDLKFQPGFRDEEKTWAEIADMKAKLVEILRKEEKEKVKPEALYVWSHYIANKMGEVERKEQVNRLKRDDSSVKDSIIASYWLRVEKAADSTGIPVVEVRQNNTREEFLKYLYETHEESPTIEFELRSPRNDDDPQSNPVIVGGEGNTGRTRS